MSSINDNYRQNNYTNSTETNNYHVGNDENVCVVKVNVGNIDSPNFQSFYVTNCSDIRVNVFCKYADKDTELERCCCSIF